MTRTSTELSWLRISCCSVYTKKHRNYSVKHSHIGHFVRLIQLQRKRGGVAGK